MMHRRWLRPIVMALACGLMALPLSVKARLGETVAQCEGRYGPPVDKRPCTVAASDEDALVYSKNGITVIIEFHDGRAWCITYRYSGMNFAQMEALLMANSGGRLWSTPLKYGSNEYRLLDDRNRLAVLNMDAKSKLLGMEVMMRDFTKEKRAKQVEVQSSSGSSTGPTPAAVLPGF